MVLDTKADVSAMSNKVESVAAGVKGIGCQFIDLRDNFDKMSSKMDKLRAKVDGMHLQSMKTSVIFLSFKKLDRIHWLRLKKC